MFDQTSRRRFFAQGAGALGLAALAGRVGAQEPASPAEMTRKAVAFLKGRQEPNGGWSTSRNEPGITALVVAALLRSKQVTPADPAVTKGLAYLEQFVGPKGGLSEAAHANYSTAIALMAFKDANVNGRYDSILKGGQDFLRDKQWDESEGKDRSSDFY